MQKNPSKIYEKFIDTQPVILLNLSRVLLPEKVADKIEQQWKNLALVMDEISLFTSGLLHLDFSLYLLHFLSS